jgi:hypothetical protein
MFFVKARITRENMTVETNSDSSFNGVLCLVTVICDRSKGSPHALQNAPLWNRSLFIFLNAIAFFEDITREKGKCHANRATTHVSTGSFLEGVGSGTCLLRVSAHPSGVATAT